MTTTRHAVSGRVDFACPHCGKGAALACLDAKEVLLHDAPPCDDFVAANPADYLAAVNARLRAKGRD